MQLLRPSTLILRRQTVPRILQRMASSAAAVAPVESNGANGHHGQEQRKRPFQHNNKRQNKKHKKVESMVKQGTHDEVLLYDVQALLKRFSIRRDTSPSAEQKENGVQEWKPSGALPEVQSEIDLTINEISSVGDGLAYDEKS